MAKKRKRLFRWVLYNQLLLFFSFCQGCTQLQDRVRIIGDCDANTLQAIEIILSESSLRYERMLVMSENACRQCLDEALEAFEKTKNKDVVVILVANSQEVGRQLTAIYRRQNIRFVVPSLDIFNSILAIDKTLYSSLFVGVKQKRENEFSVVDSKKDNRPSLPPSAIISFLLSDN